MKLQIPTTDGLNVITGYGTGYVAINGVRRAHSVIITPVGDAVPWAATDIASLTIDDLAPLLAHGAAVVLLGSGETLRFPPAAVRRHFGDARLPVEIMDSGAAARTFNVLVAEGRHVACGLIVGQP